nr:hypothetical protein [Tanacetum cinerariifolium]
FWLIRLKKLMYSFKLFEANESPSTGVLFSVVPSSRIISRLSTSNSGSALDCGFLFRLSDDLRDNCVFWRSSKSSGSSSERGYLNWKDHGEVYEAAPLGNRREDEGSYQHDMHGLLDDLFPTSPMEGNNADTSEGKENTSLNTKPVKNDGTKLNDLLKDVEQKELKDLWGGIETFDACARENFKLKAAVLSTILDFPRYANLSGWSTKGEYACPVCAYDKTSKWLDHGRKWCYMDHQRWLEHDHCWRRDIRSFDGNEDLRHAPIPHSGDDVLNIIENIDLNNKNDFRGPWKKKSIFFELPYWKGLLLPHNLDVKHIKKNLNERKLIGMKSYGCHMLMQEYLPIALCGTLSDLVSTVLIELCDFFRQICLKDLDENDLQFLES